MKSWKLFLWIAAHAVLAKAAVISPLVPTAHAYFVLAIGIFWAIRGNAFNVSCVTAYIVGAEVLWRMTHAVIFWEYGKYAIGLILLIYLITKGWKRPILPLLYFILLLPSTIALPMMMKNVDRVNYGDISFNLSGPFCLMLCVLFFSKIMLTRPQLVRIFQYMIFPVFSVFCIARQYTSKMEGASFQSASNMMASGGFGPNQVSSMLGLAALFCFFILLAQRTGFIQKIIILSATGLFAAQSALTFSRSGLYFAVLSALFALSYFLRNRKNISRFILLVSILGFVGSAYIWPQLNTFTSGAIDKRFHDTKLTHREEIWRDDLTIFKKNPLFGVGPGQSKRKRSIVEIQGVVGHIEPTRMLSEHGVFGLLSLIMLGLMVLGVFLSKRDYIAKGYAVAFVVWAGASMSINGMRIAAPSFLFGLAFVNLITDSVLLNLLRRGNEPGPENPKPVTTNV